MKSRVGQEVGCNITHIYIHGIVCYCIIKKVYGGEKKVRSIFVH